MCLLPLSEIQKENCRSQGENRREDVGLSSCFWRFHFAWLPYGYHADVHVTLIPQFIHRAKIPQNVDLKKRPCVPPEPLDD